MQADPPAAVGKGAAGQRGGRELTADPAGQDLVVHLGPDLDGAGAHGPDAPVSVHVGHAVVLGAPADLRVLGGVLNAEAEALPHAEEADVGLVQGGGVLGGRRLEGAADPAGQLRTGELRVDPGGAGAHGGDAARLIHGGDLLIFRGPEDLQAPRRAGDGEGKALAGAEKADVGPVQAGSPVRGKGDGGLRLGRLRGDRRGGQGLGGQGRGGGLGAPLHGGRGGGDRGALGLLLLAAARQQGQRQQGEEQQASQRGAKRRGDPPAGFEIILTHGTNLLCMDWMEADPGMGFAFLRFRRRKARFVPQVFSQRGSLRRRGGTPPRSSAWAFSGLPLDRALVIGPPPPPSWRSAPEGSHNPSDSDPAYLAAIAA